LIKFIDLEIKDTTDTDMSASYLDLLLPRNWQWGTVKNETLWQKRWFQFSHVELFIHM